MNRHALLAILVAAAPAWAGTARITVTSEPAGARLYLDTLFAGETPASVDAPEGRLLLRLIGGDPADWLATVVTDTVTLSAGQDTTLHYELPGRYYLNTVPSGAGVYRGDSLAGTTPIVLSRSLLAQGGLTLRKDGYQAALIDGGAFGAGSLILPLSLDPAFEPAQKAMALGTPQRSHLRLHLSGYSTLLFGLMTAYLKARADDANEAFLRTQDPAYLARRDRLDRQAAISIIATEIALGFFIYFLLLE